MQTITVYLALLKLSTWRTAVGLACSPSMHSAVRHTSKSPVESEPEQGDQLSKAVGY